MTHDEEESPLPVPDEFRIIPDDPHWNDVRAWALNVNRLIKAVAEHAAFKHPMFTGLLLLLIGGYWLKQWEQDRSAQRSLANLERQEAVTLVHETAAVVNEAVSSFYAWVRNPTDTENTDDLDDAIANLYYHRFEVTLKDRAYLSGKDYELDRWYQNLMIAFTDARQNLAADKPTADKVNRCEQFLIEKLKQWQADDPTLELRREDDNSMDAEPSMETWYEYEGFESPAEAKSLFLRAITIANLLFDRSDLILLRSLKRAIEPRALAVTRDAPIGSDLQLGPPQTLTRPGRPSSNRQLAQLVTQGTEGPMNPKVPPSRALENGKSNGHIAVIVSLSGRSSCCSVLPKSDQVIDASWSPS